MINRGGCCDDAGQFADGVAGGVAGANLPGGAGMSVIFLVPDTTAL
jgi:hypothetical protein